MEAPKILQASAFHRSFLVHTGVAPCRADEDLLGPKAQQAFAHALWLLGEVPQFVGTGRREKAMRWVCFTQGVLWTSGLVTTHILKDVMRPDDASYDPRV